MPVYKFTPDLDIDTLIEITVGREKLVNHILEDLNNAAKGNYRNHYLIVGPRGIGKTHFILLLHHAIKNGELSNQFIPIKFAEEEYSIISINHLFSRAVQRLCMEEGQEIGEMREILTRPLFKDVEHALEALRRLKKETGKRLILMLENLHLLFDALGKQGISRLRSILQEEDTFTIIGTAPMVLDEVADARQPLYHFFKQETLPALTDSQTVELLQKLEKKTGQTKINFESDGNKIRALNMLTGGYPRLILWLYDILGTSRIIDVEQNLLSLLDELSAYYTLRMEGMPAQQRAIFDAIAQFKEPVGPTQLSNELGLDVRKISTQLQRMTKAGYIRKVYPGKRRKRALYEITDRLFRYWRGIREPFGRERLGLTIRFFNLWYGSKEWNREFERSLEQTMGTYREGKGEAVREPVLPGECRGSQTVKDCSWNVETERTLNNRIQLHFRISHNSLSRDDLRKAHEHLQEALVGCKETSNDGRQEFIVSYLKSISSSGQMAFIQEALETIVRKLGKEYQELLKPYFGALEYAKTNDADVLLTLQQEQRELAREIAEMMKTRKDGGKDEQ